VICGNAAGRWLYLLNGKVDRPQLGPRCLPFKTGRGHDHEWVRASGISMSPAFGIPSGGGDSNVKGFVLNA